MTHHSIAGADTSFVLRLLVGEPEKQAAAALNELNRRVNDGGRIAVSDLVVAETYFALQHHYGVPKAEAIKTLREFLSAPEIAALGAASEVLKQKNLAKTNPGLVDRLIHADYLKQCSGMLSFEKAARKWVGTVVPG